MYVFLRLESSDILPLQKQANTLFFAPVSFLKIILFYEICILSSNFYLSFFQLNYI